MRPRSEVTSLAGPTVTKVGAVLFLLLTTAVAASAEFETRRTTVPPSLAQLVQGNSRISDISDRGSQARPADASDYRVDTGDRVSVTVYQEADLSVKGVRVKANGTISYPLLGDLHVSGLTSQEVHDLVKEKLLDGYLKKPNLTVSIDSYRLYYIKGEVKRPGGYSYVDGLTVAKAVALAGGYTVRASESSISLVRESDPEVPLESVKSNTAIHPGDIITVGESFF
jgi:polysaccharide export outer membrane protein